MEKLQEKKQANAQQEQAANAIKLYYETLQAKRPSKAEALIQPPGPKRYDAFHGRDRPSIHEPGARPALTAKVLVIQE